MGTNIYINEKIYITTDTRKLIDFDSAIKQGKIPKFNQEELQWIHIQAGSFYGSTLAEFLQGELSENYEKLWEFDSEDAQRFIENVDEILSGNENDIYVPIIEEERLKERFMEDIKEVRDVLENAIERGIEWFEICLWY